MKKKKIIIIAVIAIIVIIAAILGILYAKTDLFTSKENLFYKYLFKTQLVKPEVSQKYEDITGNIKNSNYSSNGNISCSMSANDNSTNISNIQNLFNIKYNMLSNRELSQSYADFTVSSNNQNIITVKYLKDDNTYGLKIDNVLTKYLALENTNLKEFFTKLGIQDVSKIPDSISVIAIKELLNIDDEALNTIKDTYGNVITEKLEADNFIKNTNSNKTVTIQLSLTEQEVADIEKALLETLKNDDNTLNLIINKAKILEYELNIDSMKTKIQEQIDEITNQTYSSDSEYLKIAITENGKDTVKLDFKMIVKDDEDDSKTSQVSFSIDLSEDNKIIVIMSDGQENNERLDITFGYEDNSVLTNIEIFNIDEMGNVQSNVGKVQYQINNYETNNVTQDLAITLNSDENTTIQVSVNNEIQLKQDVQIEKMNSENTELLNNKTSEELTQLIYAIIARMQYLYGDQINNISSAIQ